MRLFGGFLLSAALSLFLLARLEKEETAFRLLLSLLSFVREIRQKISAFGMPLDDIVNGYTDRTLEEHGFLTTAREKGVSEAGAILRKKGLPSPAVASSLGEFFSSLGKGFQAEEIRKCDAMERLLEKEREETHTALAKTKKITRALILTGTLFILIILW